MKMQRFYGLALVAGVIGCATTVQQSSPAPHPVPVREEMRVDLWMSGDRLVRRGDNVRLSFRANTSGYAFVGRIDTEGRLQVLWPRTPSDVDHVWANETYEVRRYGDRAFSVDDRSGTGYVFAIVSERPMASLRWARNFNWDYDALGSPVRGDPYVAMHRVAERLVGDPDGYYDLTYLDYHVERRYAYPRFVCYDCHYGTRHPVYDVYDHACVKYRVVIYDDPDYYPHRYGGRRVVYSRPRYEFKPVAANEPAGTIEYRRRTATSDTRRPGRPTEDPNIPRPNGGGGSAGATRPGDDDAGRPARDPRDDRRGGGQGQGQSQGRDRNSPPTWEQQPGNSGGGNQGGGNQGGGNQGGGNQGGGNQGGGQGNGGGNGNGGNGGNNNGCNGVGNPCNGNNGNGNSGNNGNAGGGNPGNGNAGGNGNGNSGGNGNGNSGNGNNGSGNNGNGNNGSGGNGGGNGNVRRPVVSEPVREEPRRQEPQREEAQRTEPRREEAPRQERPREEPRREEPRREEPRREEPRREEPPRQAQPERREPPKTESKPASRPKEIEPRRRP